MVRCVHIIWLFYSHVHYQKYLEAHLDTRDGSICYLNKRNPISYELAFQRTNLLKNILGLLIPLASEWNNTIEFVVKPFGATENCVLYQDKFVDDDYRFLKNQ